MNKDLLIRGTAHQNNFRVYAVQCTQAAQKARDLHDLSPIASILLGRMLSAAAMLSWDLKHPDAEVTLRVDGDGELGGGIVVSTAQAKLRGYVFIPQLFLENTADNLLPGKALGKGTLSLIRNDTHRKNFTGTCELISGEIAEDLANYYLQSEQIPTAVNLGVLIDNEARIRSCGGFMIQQLPFADIAIAEQINQNIQATPNISDLMDMGLGIIEVLDRFVFKGLQWQTNEEREPAFQCTCSKERFARALMLLGKTELEGMLEGIKPVCHYCNTEYVFSHDDMMNIVKSLKETT